MSVEVLNFPEYLHPWGRSRSYVQRRSRVPDEVVLGIRVFGIAQT